MMIAGQDTTEWHGTPLVLLPDRALLMPECDTLLVADIHLGKNASFRDRGIPVPEAVTEGDLRRLTRLIEATEVGTLIVLGDLIHDRAAMEPLTHDKIRSWRDRHPDLRVQLVPGNHDRHAGDLGRLEIERLPHRHHHGGLDLVHATAEREEHPTLGGHLHPCIRLAGSRGERLRTPCFWLEGNRGLLPAFGGFTGGRVMQMTRSVRAWAAGREDVVRLHAEPID